MKTRSSRIGEAIRGASVTMLAIVAILSFALSHAHAELPDAPDVPETAVAEGAPEEGNNRARTALLLDHDEVRPGERLRAGVWFGMAPDWHIYWLNSGESGFATELFWSLDHADAGDTKYPAPNVYEEADGFITTYGYSNEVVLFAELEVADDAQGEIEISVEADFLICKVDCIPGALSMTRTLRVGDERVANDDGMSRIEAATAAMPLEISDLGWNVDVVFDHDGIAPGQTVRTIIGLDHCGAVDEEACPELTPVGNARKEAFIPGAVDGLSFEWLGMRAHPDAPLGRLIELNMTADRDTSTNESVSGVLNLRIGGERLPIQIEASIPRAPRGGTTEPEDHPWLTPLDELELDLGPEERDTESASTGPLGPAPMEPGVPIPWWQALLFAFIGGLLLNLMPCVFPILAIKVYGFTSLVHERRSTILLHSAAYTAGIVGSLLLLAAAVIALRAGGTAVGWGFQFQEPLFIAFVGAVLIIFAANLFGAFEIGVGADRLDTMAHKAQGPRKSFFEGILAVILATPCSAPFLGTAVGFALAGSAWLIAAIFAVLGLGLAMPYVVLSLVPGWARFIPRPGPWMERFRQVLGFALVATTIWLLWIVGQIAGPDGMAMLLVFLLACALGAWIYGACQRGGHVARLIGTAAAVIVIAGTGFFTLSFDSEHEPSSSSATAGGVDWQTWDEDVIAERLSEGHPVFVDFTADWCITCKFNERTVINTARVIEAIEEHDVVMFMADWTRRDDRIREVLARHGKAGVPMYLMYSPDNPNNPEVLPELLTVDMLTSSFAAAAGATAP